jgi:hypothetical protein
MVTTSAVEVWGNLSMMEAASVVEVAMRGVPALAPAVGKGVPVFASMAGAPETTTIVGVVGGWTPALVPGAPAVDIFWTRDPHSTAAGVFHAKEGLVVSGGHYHLHGLDECPLWAYLHCVF